MNFAFKHIVAALAFVAAGATNAANVSIDTDGTTEQNGIKVSATSELQFSHGLMQFLANQPSPAGVTPYGNATLTKKDPCGDCVYPDEVTPGDIGPLRYFVGAPVVNLTHDTVTGKLSEVDSVDGVRLSLDTSLPHGVAGGWAEVGELDVQFQADGSAQVFGKISGQRLGASSAVNYSGLMFTVAAADVHNATFNSAPGTYDTTLNNLVLSQPASQALVTSWGLSSAGSARSDWTVAGANFGNLRYSVTVTTAVPEPSTYLLMGVGLLGLGLMARRRAN